MRTSDKRYCSNMVVTLCTLPEPSLMVILNAGSDANSSQSSEAKPKNSIPALAHGFVDAKQYLAKKILSSRSVEFSALQRYNGLLAALSTSYRISKQRVQIGPWRLSCIDFGSICTVHIHESASGIVM